jgi:hypothetical protein
MVLVGLPGVEPGTSRLSGVRSNHLSYRPTVDSPRWDFYVLIHPTEGSRARSTFA